MKFHFTLTALFAFALAGPASVANYSGGKFSSLVYALTAPEGANSPATASANRFPLKYRLVT